MTASIFYPYQLTSVAQLDETARACTERGVDRLWLVESFGVDVWSAVAAVGRSYPALRFGTAVSLMPWRHPLDLATRLRAMAELLPDRFSAGLGMSERTVVEDVLGGRYPSSPVTYTREYLDVLRRCLTGGPAHVAGQYFSVWTNDLGATVRPRDVPELLVGALGPGMAEVGADAGDGCVTWLVPPALVRDLIVPAARTGGGRVVTLVPCLPLTSRADVRQQVVELLGLHLSTPHYARMLRRAAGGVTADGLIDVVVDEVVAWGPPDAIRERLDAYAAAGADEVAVAAYDLPTVLPGSFRDTLDLVVA